MRVPSFHRGYSSQSGQAGLSGRVYFVPFVWLLACSLAFGQVSKLVDTDAFSETALHLNFQDIGWGPEAARAYRELGILFSGEGSSNPIRRTVAIPPLAAWQFVDVLRNHSDTSSAGEALIVRFDHSVRRVGFLLGNGRRETHAVLSAFTARGEALGSIEQKGIHPVRGPAGRLHPVLRFASAVVSPGGVMQSWMRSSKIGQRLPSRFSSRNFE